MKPSTAPCHDPLLCPLYQVDYCAKRAGKHIAASKRRVMFRFGFSSAAAVAAGRSGTDCRGEEHEVVFVWSHVTGKRQLLVDGQEVHRSSMGLGNTEFQHSWRLAEGHRMKIIADGRPQNSWSRQRQFDLTLDGTSFFEFKKVYELGNSAVERADFPPMPSSPFGTASNARDGEEREKDAPEARVLLVDLLDSPQPPSTISPVTVFVPSLVGSATSSATPDSSDSESLSGLCGYVARSPAEPVKAQPSQPYYQQQPHSLLMAHQYVSALSYEHREAPPKVGHESAY